MALGARCQRTHPDLPGGVHEQPRLDLWPHTSASRCIARVRRCTEILGYAIDFTAETGDDGGLVYIAKGTTGFYPAFFNLRPYYQQLKRYSDWENRDIWEYRLDVDQDQVDFLLMHLWELKDVEFPYYFFTKNCSYELLRLLEIGVADLRSKRAFSRPCLSGGHGARRHRPARVRDEHPLPRFARDESFAPLCVRYRAETVAAFARSWRAASNPRTKRSTKSRRSATRGFSNSRTTSFATTTWLGTSAKRTHEDSRGAS